MARKQRRVAPRNFAWLIDYLSINFAWCLQEVTSYLSRSGHQVSWNDPTSSHFCAYLLLCQSQRWWPSFLKLGGCYKVIVAYNLYISYFSDWWPKVRPISWPPCYKAMGEKPNPSFTHQARIFYDELNWIRLLLMHQVQILVRDLHRDHLGSPEVTTCFY